MNSHKRLVTIGAAGLFLAATFFTSVFGPAATPFAAATFLATFVATSFLFPLPDRSAFSRVMAAGFFGGFVFLGIGFLFFMGRLAEPPITFVIAAAVAGFLFAAAAFFPGFFRNNFAAHGRGRVPLRKRMADSVTG